MQWYKRYMTIVKNDIDQNRNPDVPIDEYDTVRLPGGELIAPELGFTKLMVLLADTNSAYRTAALRAMAKLRGNKVANLIVGRLNDCAVNVRVEACRQIAELSLRNAVPKLYDSLNDRQPYVVCAAARALHHFGDNIGFEYVCKAALKKGAHQIEAVKCMNLFLDKKLPEDEKGLKAVLKMYAESKFQLFTIN